MPPSNSNDISGISRKHFTELPLHDSRLIILYSHLNFKIISAGSAQHLARNSADRQHNEAFKNILGTVINENR